MGPGDEASVEVGPALVDFTVVCRKFSSINDVGKIPAQVYSRDSSVQICTKETLIFVGNFPTI